MAHNCEHVNNIRIAVINVISIVAHCRRLELLQFLRDHNHDVVLLSETKLNPTHKLAFEGYKLIRRDGPNSVKGGGTAISIKDNFPFEEISPPSTLSNKIIEYTM